MELKAIENKIVTIRGQQVILDRDIARLYDVETKRIDRKSTRLNSSHIEESRMPSSA